MFVACPDCFLAYSEGVAGICALLEMATKILSTLDHNKKCTHKVIKCC
jgi:hypothetical protein